MFTYYAAISGATKNNRVECCNAFGTVTEEDDRLKMYWRENEKKNVSCHVSKDAKVQKSGLNSGLQSAIFTD